jgi:phosphotransacetylase
MNVNPGDTALSSDEIKSRTDAANKILTQFQKEDRKVTDQLTDALDSKDEERIARAQLKLIEQRMKYIIANANKGQDRLTVADIKDAEQNTKIFDFLNDPEQIKKITQLLKKN